MRPDRPTVLVVQHEHDAPAGWVGDWLVEEAVALDVRRPDAGEALPSSLADHDGLLVLGGEMDSWDDASAPWLPATRALIAEAARDGVPTLAICLGHQLVALALGGTTGRNPAGATAGVVPVGWTAEAAADPVFAHVTAKTAVHFNRDVATALPPAAVVLARSVDGAVQAARMAPSVWGVQCHPEVDAQIVASWLGGPPPPGEAAPDAPALIDDVRRAEPDLADGWRPMVTAWVAVVRRAARAGGGAA